VSSMHLAILFLLVDDLTHIYSILSEDEERQLDVERLKKSQNVFTLSVSLIFFRLKWSILLIADVLPWIM